MTIGKEERIVANDHTEKIKLIEKFHLLCVITIRSLHSQFNLTSVQAMELVGSCAVQLLLPIQQMLPNVARAKNNLHQREKSNQ